MSDDNDAPLPIVDDEEDRRGFVGSPSITAWGVGRSFPVAFPEPSPDLLDLPREQTRQGYYWEWDARPQRVEAKPWTESSSPTPLADLLALMKAMRRYGEAFEELQRDEDTMIPTQIILDGETQTGLFLLPTFRAGDFLFLVRGNENRLVTVKLVTFYCVDGINEKLPTMQSLNVATHTVLKEDSEMGNYSMWSPRCIVSIEHRL